MELVEAADPLGLISWRRMATPVSVHSFTMPPWLHGSPAIHLMPQVREPGLGPIASHSALDPLVHHA